MVAVGLSPGDDGQKEVAKDSEVGVKKDHLGLAVLFSTCVAGRRANNKVGVAEAQDKGPPAAVPTEAFPLKAELKTHTASEAAESSPEPARGPGPPPPLGGAGDPKPPSIKRVQGQPSEGLWRAGPAQVNPGPGPAYGAGLARRGKRERGAAAGRL